MNAYNDLIEILDPDEQIEAIVFGPWGWSNSNDVAEKRTGYGEPDDPPVPFDLRGKLLTPDQAQPYMEGWSFFGGFGAPECYAIYIWTNKRVIWVTQYDGSTELDSAPRHPIECMPDMPGG